MDEPGFGHQHDPLTLRRDLPARREVLWDYVSTAGGLACWQADSVEGDLTEGSFSLRWPDLGARLDLSVQEIEVGHRLKLGAGATSLDLRVGDGYIELCHRGLDAEDDVSGFESSWNIALSLLEIAVTRHPRKERKVAWLFQRLQTKADLLDIYFSDKPAVASWLGTTQKSWVSGCPYELELFGGIVLDGKVLHASRDVCLHVASWQDGALTLRSLPGPDDQRIAAISVSTWGNEVSDEILAALKGALSRLKATTEHRSD